MKILITIPLTLLVLINSYGQITIDNFTLELSVSYLPSAYGQTEQFVYNGKQVDYFSSKTANIKRNRKAKNKKTKSVADNSIVQAVLLFDSLFKTNSFKIKPTYNLKDTILSHKIWNENTGLTDSSILTFFNNYPDTIHFDLKVLKDYYDKYPNQLPIRQIGPEGVDGCPYYFNLVIGFKGGDTINYSFNGNLTGFPSDNNLKNWFVWYLVTSRYQTFKEHHIQEYLGDRNLERVTRLFIRWTE